MGQAKTCSQWIEEASKYHKAGRYVLALESFKQARNRMPGATPKDVRNFIDQTIKQLTREVAKADRPKPTKASRNRAGISHRPTEARNNPPTPPNPSEGSKGHPRAPESKPMVAIPGTMHPGRRSRDNHTMSVPADFANSVSRAFSCFTAPEEAERKWVRLYDDAIVKKGRPRSVSNTQSPKLRYVTRGPVIYDLWKSESGSDYADCVAVARNQHTAALLCMDLNRYIESKKE